MSKIAIIQVSPDDFIKTHASLVHLLLTIQSAGTGGIPTKRLCDCAFNARRYGLRVIKEANKEGYIIRVKVDSKGKKKSVITPNKSSMRGGYRVMNMLSPKGKRLLSKLYRD
jgi:hypothetical protein